MSRSAPPPDAEKFTQQLREAQEKFAGAMGGEGPSQQVMAGFAEAYRAGVEAMAAQPGRMLDPQGGHIQEPKRLWMQAMQPTKGEGGSGRGQSLKAPGW